MKVHALILGNIDPLSGCEFKTSIALEMIATSRKGLTSWRSSVVSNCEFVTFPLVDCIDS